jgi:hypothetical protein
MEKKTKIWLIVGLFVIAAIIAFAIYKGIGSSKDTTVVTQGGTTTTNSGLGNLLGNLKGVLDGLKLSFV